MLDAVLVKEYLSVSFRAKVEKWERDLSKNQTPPHCLVIISSWSTDMFGLVIDWYILAFALLLTIFFLQRWSIKD